LLTEQYGPTLIANPGQQVPIRGEANVARYLARLISPSYDSDIVVGTQIDTVLDKAADLLQSDAAQSANIIASVSDFLRGSGKSKSGWLLGYGRQSLADVVMWSAVKQRGTGKLPEDVEQWVSRCNQLPEFTSASRLVS
jgi:aminoacyl tRNA synthase complex-interacting multifunctional protein 2